jgi:hypothetical protein
MQKYKHDNITYKISLTTFPSEFMTCRQQRGCNRRPGEHCKAGTRNKKTTIYMHGVKAVVYLFKFKAMRDILVDLHVSFQVICGNGKGSQTRA